MAMKSKFNESEAFEEAIKQQLSEKFGTVKLSWLPLISTVRQQYELYLNAMDAIGKEGLTVRGKGDSMVANPLIKVSNDAIIQVQKLCNMLGISPSSVIKLGLEKPSDNSDEEEADFLDRLVK